MPDESEFEAAIERLLDPERFSEAERVVAQAAPQLQKVLAAALAEGGWFGEPHEAEALRAATVPDPDERIAAVRALLAEEARMGMMVGVAVGWALKEEMTDPDDETERESAEDGDQVSRPVLLRAERRRGDAAGRPVPEAEQPGRGGHRRGGRADPHRDQPRPRRPHGRRGRRSPSAPAPTAWRSSSSPNWLEGQGVENGQRPQPRRHGQLRLGLDQARPRLAHEHHRRLRRGALQRRARDRDRAPPPGW